MSHKRLVLFLIGFFAIIVVISLIVAVIPSSQKIGWLGIIGSIGDGCSGELEVTSKPVDDKCGLQANLTMHNCQGRKWYVIEGGSCTENHICTGTINEPTANWKCTWESSKGTYTFTLCADDSIKARITVSC